MFPTSGTTGVSQVSFCMIHTAELCSYRYCPATSL